MFRFTVLTAALASVVVLGAMIDAQSQTPRDEPARFPRDGAIFAPGRVEGATDELDLRFQLAGVVEEILVQDGEQVKQGQALLRLDTCQLREEVVLAEAEVELYEAQRERLLNGARPEERAEAAALWEAKVAQHLRANRDWQRTDALRNKNAMSQQEADNAQGAVDSLQAEVAAAKARLDQVNAPPRADEIRIAVARVQAAKTRLALAKIQLDRATLKAPSDGQILKLHIERGEAAGPDAPRPALTMTDNRLLRVRAFVEEVDATRVAIGMPALVTADGLAERTYRGTITEVSPLMIPKAIWTADPDERYDTKSREVWINLEQHDALVIGLRVDVQMQPDTFLAQEQGAESREQAR